MKFLKNYKFNQFKKSIHSDFSKLSDKELLSLASSNKDSIYLLNVVKEASKRVLGKNPYDEQLYGAKIIIDGMISEMKTGEGKSLVAAIAATVLGIQKRQVNIVTVNDYLVERDLTEQKPLFDFFNLSSGMILSSDKDPKSKKLAYSSSIIYATNSELCFDYLRDNMVYDKDDKVQQSRDFVIIDEVDSILIDEARTPLIISGVSESNGIDLYAMNVFSDTLMSGKEIVNENYTKEYTNDFFVDVKHNSLFLTDQGIQKVEEFFKIKNLYENHDSSHIAHLVEQALIANHLYFKDVHYIIADNQLILIDENTGRLSIGKQLSNGLHQAIEAKEGIPLSVSTIVLSEISYQNFFKSFNKIGGMSGTAIGDIKEFQEIYHLDVIEVPTHKPVLRKDYKDLIFLTKNAKTKYLIKEIKKIHSKGQPILIGTASVEDNEYLATLLIKEGIPFNALNAKNAHLEAEIISNAGKVSAVTLATNMAGRGVDIKIDAAALAAGGLYVIGFERYTNSRIDNQLRGRSGRQGDVGESQFLISLEDDIIVKFGHSKLANLMNGLDFNENDIIESRFVSKSVEKAQKAVESLHFDYRKDLLKYDDIIHLQRKEIFKLRDSMLESDYDFDSKIKELVSLSMHDLFVSGSLDKELLFERFGIELPSDSVFDLDTFSKIFIGNVFNKFKNIDISDANEIIRSVYLHVVDTYWREHLTHLEEMRKGVGLRQINQKDPLIEFNKEAFHLYGDMIKIIQIKILDSLLKLEIGTATAAEAA